MASKEAILSADAASDARFDTSQSIADFRIRSMMCAPLVASSGRALGVMQIDTMDQRSRFQPDDLEVLAAVASQAAFAVENAELHETELKRQALDYDLEMAHKVQQGFLPSSPPKVEGYEFFDFYEPANQVGGDYFDYVPLSGNRIAVVTADVSGKGMPAALLMAKLSAETRYCLASEESPALAIRRLNSTFMRYGWEDRFVTMALCVLDCDKHELTLVNAGHMPPFLHTKAGEVSSLGDEITGVPLGVDDTFQYEQVKRKVAPGDSLVVFTDGISEAMNMGNELYGMSRIADQLIYQDIQTMDVLGKRLLRDVKQFVGDRAQSDDMCLLCFGRTA
jgi:serine phosphatase RsbU (regulator of sigma subunit)